MNVLSGSSRDAAAFKFSFLAVASLALIVIAAVISMSDELRAVLASLGVLAFSWLGGRAMRLWQGRGLPSLRRAAWRRHFLGEKSEPKRSKGRSVT
jgi:threonine/homoserine/homoserine lactone efflux protein